METQQPLVCPSHTTQYIGAVLVGLIVGAGASFVYFKQILADAEKASYEEGFAIARKLIEESPVGNILQIPDDVRTLTGTVMAVSGDRITLHAQALSPFDANRLDERTVVVTGDTKIFSISQKDSQVLQQEIDAIMRSVKKDGVQPELPGAYIRNMLNKVDIKTGDQIVVTAIENIKTMKEFHASEIQIK